MRPIYCQFALLGLLASSIAASAQHLPQFTNMTPEVSLAAAPQTLQPMVFQSPVLPLVRPVIQPVFVHPEAPPCAGQLEPFDVDDYNGPLNKLVAHISQRVERRTVHMPRRHSTLRPCALDAGDKFHSFLNDAFDPLTYAGAAWDAAFAQLSADDQEFQEGAAGYGKRYSAALTDSLSSGFFRTFFYPSLFHQDTRYFRMGEGPARQRIAHALAHRFIAQSDSGQRMFNYSEWLGTVSAKALSNLYHPGNQRGFGPTASRVGFSVANDMAWDVLREFWPEIAHKCRLPFRTHKDNQIKPVSPEPVLRAGMTAASLP